MVGGKKGAASTARIILTLLLKGEMGERKPLHRAASSLKVEPRGKKKRKKRECKPSLLLRLKERKKGAGQKKKTNHRGHLNNLHKKERKKRAPGVLIPDPLRCSTKKKEKRGVRGGKRREKRGCTLQDYTEG